MFPLTCWSAPPQARWLEHRGRGYRALLQDPTSGDQPQPDAGTSEVAAGDAAGDAGTQVPDQGEAAAPSITSLGATHECGPAVWRQMRVVANRNDQRMGSGSLPSP